ncbi:hypothetical protein [Exiguobacterium artemiae]|uniref:hypothetical protein n=1 Tax=Exiguobacterium artemiae TaxID=340145 RepID=UPI00047ED6BF|nr:hypothetical protein [Exiguobacterium sibiricum]
MGYKRFILILIGTFIVTTTLIITAAVKIGEVRHEKHQVETTNNESQEPLSTFLHELPEVDVKSRAEEFGKSVVDGYSLFSYFSPEAFGVKGAPEIIEGPNGESPEEMDQLIMNKVKPYGFVKKYKIKQIKEVEGNTETLFEFTTAKEKVYDVKLLYNNKGLIITKIVTD